MNGLDAWMASPSEGAKERNELRYEIRVGRERRDEGGMWAIWPRGFSAVMRSDFIFIFLEQLIR